MLPLLSTMILLLLFMAGMSSNSNRSKKIGERNAMAHVLLEDIDIAHIIPIDHKNLYPTKLKKEAKIDGKEKSQSVSPTMHISYQEAKDKKMIDFKPPKHHTEIRKKFFKYIQELNKLTFFELSKKLETLHKERYHYNFPQNNSKKYLEFFQEEELQCLISEMNPAITNARMLSEDEKAEYLHHWADWIWVFYMDECEQRRWFFAEMKSLSEATLENYKSGESSATFVMHLAHSFIRSINIYRRCKIPLTSLLSDDYVSQYLFRGIRVNTFNIDYSTFPLNFQSYSMNTAGVDSVLYFYSGQHRSHHDNTVVITMMEYNHTMQQLAQPIAIFDLMHAKYQNGKVVHSDATESEKEVLFPPFCYFALKQFESTDIKNEFQREHIVFRLWKLVTANPYNVVATDIKLLWVTEVECLSLYDSLPVPFMQSEHNEMEGERRILPDRASIYNNIEYWQSKFPQKVHACVRLFATHEQDIINQNRVVEKEELDHMILEFMEYQALVYTKIKNEIKQNHNEKISQEEYSKAFQIFKQSLSSSTYEAIFENEMLSSIQQFFKNIQHYMENQSKEKELSRYKIHLHLFFFMHEETQWNESLSYCLAWENKHMISTTNQEQNILEINDCYSTMLSDSHHGRFVCEYTDHSYSLNTDFPCRRINPTKQTEEFGRFCKLS